MKLYCMRHGCAEPVPNAAGERPLTAEGALEVTRLANYLASHKIRVSHIMHSTKVRSRQTAQLIADKVGTAKALTLLNTLEPESAIQPLLAQIDQWNDDTILVGHLPFIANLVSQLLTHQEQFALVRFTPATMVCLERCDNKQWIMTWTIRPDLI